MLPSYSEKKEKEKKVKQKKVARLRVLGDMKADRQLVTCDWVQLLCVGGCARFKTVHRSDLAPAIPRAVGHSVISQWIGISPVSNAFAIPCFGPEYYIVMQCVRGSLVQT